MKRLIIQKAHTYLRKLVVNTQWVQYGISTGPMDMKVQVNILEMQIKIYSGQMKKVVLLFLKD